MMKFFKYSIYIWISILLSGCSTDFYDEVGLSDISTEREAEEFGKQMGDNLRFVVTQMNKNGDDFGDQAKIKTAIVRYFSQQTHVKSISVEDLDRTLQGDYHFTPAQIIFLEKIREAQAKSSSANELMQYLKDIMKEIQATVPEIQQRNLLKMTIALYYITKEMDLLLKEGLMPVNLKQPQHIRLRSGGESSGFWATLLGGMCISVSDIGAAILADLEVLAASAGYCLVAAAGVVCLLFTAGDTPVDRLSDADCESLTLACINNPWKYVNGERVRKECSVCRQYCLNHHRWNNDGCPQ
ncbi:MAG: hypothetical protein LBH82_05955 [Bacteroidales bacterium]|jgi:hypothetical protein|nr:hypothetical protein [Bacteroidales bacterium]